MGRQNHVPINRRRLLVSSIAASVAVVVITLMPWPGGIRAPAVIAFAPQETLRVTSRGFVEEIHVRTGEAVEAGQRLMTLQGDDIRAELAQIEKELEQSRIRGRVWKQNNEIGAFQAETQAHAALKEKRDHLADLVAALEIRSPVDGRVLDRSLDTWLGQFVDVGTPLLTIVGDDRKEVQVSIPESHVESFTKYVGRTPTVRIRGHAGALQLGPLSRVDPRATVNLSNLALGAINGGPLPVETVAADQLDPNATHHFRLVAPRFCGVVKIPPELADDLRPGQIASVSLSGAHESVGRYVWRATTQWLRGKIAQSYR